MQPEFSVSLRDCKGIRKGLLFEALNSTQILQENVNLTTPSVLETIFYTTELINEQLSLEEKVENQDEVVLDSEVMKSSSSVIRECTNSLTRNFNTYNGNEYGEFLIEYTHRMSETIDENNIIQWSTLEFEVIGLFKKTVFYSSLSGALQPLMKIPIQKKVRTQQKRAPLSQVKKPEKIEKAEKEKEAEEASLAVQKIRKLIAHYFKETQCSLNYFQLILHPTDFGKTVENILHVAFLVRDGYIKLFAGERGQLEVVVTSKEVLSQAKSSGKKKSIQNIASLNFQQWEILKNFYKIEEPMINF